MDRSARRAGLLCAVYALATFAWYCAWKHFLAEQSSDPAIFENCFWNALHGHGLRSWLEGPAVHLAVHFSPGILLLLPLYAVFPSMHVLHAAVCLGVAGAGLVLYHEARTRLDESTSLFCMLAFLFHPTVVLQTFMEFHEQALAFLPLLLLVRSWRQERLVPSIVFALLFMSLREDNALSVLLLGALALFRPGGRRLAAALIALGALWLAAYKGIALGALAHGALPNIFATSYGQWGATPGEALRAMVTHPARVAAHLVAPEAIKYLAQLLGPLLGVLPFGNPLALVALPQLLLILLADPSLRIFQVRMHYSVVPATVAYVAAVGTLAWIATRRPRLARALAALMLVVSLATVPVWARRAVSRLNPHRERALAAMRAVPPAASVAAPGVLLNEMAKRPQLD
jgi:uncharacterized membrane protein